MDKTQIIIAIVAALPGLAAILFQVIKTRKDADRDAQRLEIEATDVAQNSVKVLLEPLNKRISDLEDFGIKCKASIAQFEELIKQKDARNLELEQIIKEKDKKIAEMQREIDELRARVAQLEKNNGGNHDSRN